MDNSISALNRRLQALETESEIARRKCDEEAQRAVKALREISPDDVEMLSGIVPSIRLIVEYKESDLRQNKNGEIDTILSVMTRLREYLEARLAFYEDQL